MSLKNGGIIVFAARYSFIGKYWYDEKLENLEALGRLKFLTSDSFFKYNNIAQGIGKFQKTPVKVFAYQKTEADSVLGYKRASSMKADQMQAFLKQGIKKLYISKKMELFQSKKKESGFSVMSGSTEGSINNF